MTGFKPLGGVAGLALVGPFGRPGGVSITLKTQRGNIDYDQIRLTARQGTGALIQMYNGAVTAVAADAVVFDGDFNLIDAGGPPVVLVATPAHHNSAGTPGQQSYDGSGNFYFCYATASWARMGAGGYSNSF
jgi:hypothetical protein